MPAGLRPLFLAAALSTLVPAAQAQRSAEPARIDPVAAGWSAPALTDVLAYAKAQRTTGLLIVQNRRIVAEANWPLTEDAERFRSQFVHGTTAEGALLEDVASQQKSFVAILAGVAIDKGLLDVSKPVSAYAGVGWSRVDAGQEAKIVVRNLLEMNSGLTERLTYGAPPDTRFFYNTPAYAVMKSVLEGASNQTLAELTRVWLTQPAGMTNTSWRQRPAAFPDVDNPTGLVTTPSDIAKMGRLVLDGGVAADGTRVISKVQVEALFTRTGTNPAYGRLWWLNGGAWTVNAGARSPRRDGQFIRSAPPDMVAAMGAMDRALFVVPSLQLIVVRTGQAAPDADFEEQLWTRLTRALP